MPIGAEPPPPMPAAGPQARDGLPSGWPAPGGEAVDAEAADDALAAVPAAAPGGQAVHSPPALDAAALAALLARVMDQDAAALAALYHQLSATVHALVLRIVRVAPLAEELTEDVFWQVWRQAPRFDPARGSVRAWVLVMARSRALDALRARRADPVLVVEDLPDDACDDGGHALGADPQDLLAAAQSGSALQAALQQLDALPRQLLALSYFRGLTQQEVAEQTGLPLGTVKTHVRRALAQLRTALARDQRPVADLGGAAP